MMFLLKCPQCKQSIIFKIPDSIRNKPKPNADKTQIGDTVTFSSTDVFLVDKTSRRRYKLRLGKNIIGRKGDVEIDNNDSYVSRFHCLIEMVKTANGCDIILMDDGSVSGTGKPSTNGTFHNGEKLTKIDKIFLEKNDEIRLGKRTTLVVAFG